MKKVENITVWQCEFCGVKQFRNNKRHEKFCRKNPNNQHQCFEFCKHLKRIVEFPNTIFICDVTKKSMYSYLAEKKEWQFPKEFFKENERMPLTCKYFERLEDDGDGHYLTEERKKELEEKLDL